MVITTPPSVATTSRPLAVEDSPPSKVVHGAASSSAAAAAGAAKPGTVADGWKLLDETNTTGAIVDAVDGAKQVVNAEFFGFTDAGKGAQLTTALQNAASRGVEVNVLTDFTSAFALPPGSWQRMRRKVEDAGGSVILTSPIPGSSRAKDAPALKHVDHRKLVTVDGTTGFVGGMNFVPLTDSYADTMVRLSGLPAARLAADQLRRWGSVGGKITPRHVRSVEDALAGRDLVPKDPRELRIVTNAPETKRFELTEGYADLIRNAKERLWIATPGISDRDIMDEINAAAKRGVDVRIVASEKPPVLPLIGWVARAHMTDLVNSGGTAYEVPGTLHRKVIVADDEVILSSYNLTKRSANADHEVGVRTKDPGFVDAIAALLRNDIERSRKFDPATNTGVGAKIGKFFADRVSY